MNIHLAAGKLLVAIDGVPEFEILPVAPNQFKAGSERLEFMRNQLGTPAQVFFYDKGTIAGAQREE